MPGRNQGHRASRHREPRLTWRCLISAPHLQSSRGHAGQPPDIVHQVIRSHWGEHLAVPGRPIQPVTSLFTTLVVDPEYIFPAIAHMYPPDPRRRRANGLDCLDPPIGFPFLQRNPTFALPVVPPASNRPTGVRLIDTSAPTAVALLDRPPGRSVAEGHASFLRRSVPALHNEDAE